MKIPSGMLLLLAGILFSASIVPVPAAGEDKLSLRTVVIDPGHGGHDSGCISPDKKTYEKNLTLAISKLFAEKIRSAYPDVKVIMTRNDDRYVTLSGRADIANNASADLFISIHINAQAKGNSASGYSIHCLGQSSKQGNDLFGKNLDLVQRENSVILLEDDYQTKYQGFDPSDPQSYIFFSLMQNAHLEHSLIFAEDVAEAMKGGPITRNRGVSQDPFWVLWRTAMPAVLVEVGFISNAGDLQAMRSPQGREKIADNLLKAFKTFKARYDGSASVSRQPVPETKAAEEAGETMVADEPAKKEEAKPSSARDASGSQYAIQVLATSKKMKSSDAFFRGYEPTEVRAGKLYKYLILPDGDLSATRKKWKEVQKKFPGCFIVLREGETLTRIP